MENKTSPKFHQQIYSENYQKNKERKKARRKESYAQQKEQLTVSKYYRASNTRLRKKTIKPKQKFLVNNYQKIKGLKTKNKKNNN